MHHSTDHTPIPPLCVYRHPTVECTIWQRVQPYPANCCISTTGLQGCAQDRAPSGSSKFCQREAVSVRQPRSRKHKYFSKSAWIPSRICVKYCWLNMRILFLSSLFFSSNSDAPVLLLGHCTQMCHARSQNVLTLAITQAPIGQHHYVWLTWTQKCSAPRAKETQPAH